jgi:hypothetical protein
MKLNKTITFRLPILFVPYNFHVGNLQLFDHISTKKKYFNKIMMLPLRKKTVDWLKFTIRNLLFDPDIELQKLQEQRV